MINETRRSYMRDALGHLLRFVYFRAIGRNDRSAFEGEMFDLCMEGAALCRRIEDIRRAMEPRRRSRVRAAARTVVLVFAWALAWHLLFEVIAEVRGEPTVINCYIRGLTGTDDGRCDG